MRTTTAALATTSLATTVLAAAGLVAGAVPAHAAQGPFADGTYAVGATLEPGLYRTLGGPTCYWARSRDASGGVASIIANRFMLGGRAVVEVEASDGVFTTQGCGTWWPVVEGDMVPASTIEPGDVLVGRDVEPGTYASAGGVGCYWSRSSDASGEIASIIANRLGDGPAVVEIAEDDVFRTERCALWVKQPS